MYLLLTLVMLPATVVLLLGLGWIQGTVSTARLLVMTLVVVPVLTWPALLALSIAAKWILIGRYRPGEYALWSGTT